MLSHLSDIEELIYSIRNIRDLGVILKVLLKEVLRLHGPTEVSCPLGLDMATAQNLVDEFEGLLSLKFNDKILRFDRQENMYQDTVNSVLTNTQTDKGRR